MNTIEILMQLASVRTRRELMIDRVTRENDQSFNVAEIMRDNEETDIDIRRHFLKIVPEVTELHLKRCIDSDVALCRCMPDRALQGQGEPI